MSIYAEVNETQLRDVQAMLAGIKNGAPRAISSGINKTVTKTQSRVVTDVYQEINTTKKVIRNFVTTKKANFRDLTGWVRISGKPMPLTVFGAKQTTTGVSVRVRRKEGIERHRGEFIATMGSGHRGVFTRRVYGTDKYRVHRLPIDEQFGPSVPMVFHHNAEAKTTRDMADELAVNVDKEVERILKGYF